MGGVWKLCSSPISRRLVSCSASTGLLTARCTGLADVGRYTPGSPFFPSNKLADNFLLLEMQVQNKIQYLFETEKYYRHQINTSIYQCQHPRIYRDSTSFDLGIPAGMLFFFLVHKIYRKCSQIPVEPINYCISGYGLSSKEKRT